ncbi:hypothetical protein BDZ89DRAFT_574226 [Hymenopellis radicata]|nr:hypothetical protein BDZ89DRAFT_574226 [Hymenopellis radicata]
MIRVFLWFSPNICCHARELMFAWPCGKLLVSMVPDTPNSLGCSLPVAGMRTMIVASHRHLVGEESKNETGGDAISLLPILSFVFFNFVS